MPRYGLRVSRARNVARRPKDPVTSTKKIYQFNTYYNQCYYD